MWPWRRREPENLISISDPLLVEYFNLGAQNFTGVSVNESSALGLSAVWRAVSLISQTIASLSLSAVRDNADGTSERVKSWLDNPGTVSGATQFEVVETTLVHLLLHGNAYLLHIRNGAGGIVGVSPIHPLAVTPDWQTIEGKTTRFKEFRVSFHDGTQQEFTQAELTHVPAMSVDGLIGVSPIWIARNSLGTGIAGDRAAAKMFGQGALMSGLATAEEDVSEAEAKQIKEFLDAKVTGIDNASSVPFVNRKIKIQPWQMTNADAQWFESRQFSISEVARWYGIPEFLLQAEKATSWGTGIAEQQRGLARMVLAPWANRLEQRLTRLLPPGVRAEFDFHTLERGAPAEEVNLLIAQVQAGILSVDEARAARNLPPLPDAADPTEAMDQPEEVPA